MPDILEKINLSHRKMGVVLSIMSLVASYWAFYAPIAGVLANAPTIRLSYAAVFISIVGFGIGATMIALGEKHVDVFGHYNKPNIKGRVYALVFLAIAYMASSKLETFVMNHGYKQVKFNLI